MEIEGRCDVRFIFKDLTARYKELLFAFADFISTLPNDVVNKHRTAKLKKVFAAQDKVRDVMYEIWKPIFAEPSENINLGIAVGLILSGRQDLLPNYPDAEKAFLVYQAERISNGKEPL